MINIILNLKGRVLENIGRRKRAQAISVEGLSEAAVRGSLGNRPWQAEHLKDSATYRDPGMDRLMSGVRRVMATERFRRNPH